MKSTNTHIEIDELIATYLSQGLESEKLSELENWLKASPENQKHFQQMREIWFSTISANEEERYNKEEAYSRFLNRTCQIPQEEKTVKKLSLHKFFYGAAAVALLCLISFASYRTGTEQVKKQFAEMVVEAPLGSKTRLYLPDGTLVWLNAGSTITYSQGFGVEERKLKLSGEGYFEVTRNKQLPFEITTKELQLSGRRRSVRQPAGRKSELKKLSEKRCPLLSGTRSESDPEQEKRQTDGFRLRSTVYSGMDQRIPVLRRRIAAGYYQRTGKKL